MTTITPLSSNIEHAPTLLNALFVPCQITPATQPALAYTLKQPKSWRSGSADLTHPLELTCLGSFTDDVQSTVSIQAISLKREISAGDWLKYYALSLSKPILTLKPISVNWAHGILQWDSAHREHAATIIHGQWLILISCLTTEAAYQALASTFKHIITSFKLLNPPEQATIESRIPYTMANTLQFAAPASWQCQSMQANSCTLSQQSAQLKLSIEHKTAVIETAEWLEKQLDDFPQLKIQNLLHHSRLSSPNVHFSEGHLMIYAGIDHGESRELWLTRFEDQYHTVTVALLTAARTVDFYLWAVNKRAYGIILESLQKER